MHNVSETIRLSPAGQSSLFRLPHHTHHRLGDICEGASGRAQIGPDGWWLSLPG
jgi:hypothetical protein